MAGEAIPDLSFSPKPLQQCCIPSEVGRLKLRPASETQEHDGFVLQHHDALFSFPGNSLWSFGFFDAPEQRTGAFMGPPIKTLGSYSGVLIISQSLSSHTWHLGLFSLCASLCTQLVNLQFFSVVPQLYDSAKCSSSSEVPLSQVANKCVEKPGFQ